MIAASSVSAACVPHGRGREPGIEPEWPAIRLSAQYIPRHAFNNTFVAVRPRPSGERRQHERLHHELREYPAARGAERGPHQDLLLPRRRASQHQERDVAADDNQQQDGERVDRVDAGPNEQIGGKPDNRVGVRQHLRSQMRIAIRKACRARAATSAASACASRRVAPGARRPNTWQRVVAGFANQLSRTKRYPEVVVDGKREALRHHAGDRCLDVAQPHCAADHRLVTTKTRLPQAMSQDHDLGRTQILVRFHQRAPKQGRDARHPEGSGADLSDHHGLGDSSVRRRDFARPPGKRRRPAAW